MNYKEKRSIIVVGCGRLGSTIASLLSERNLNVIVLDIDQSNFRKLAASYGGLTKEGDGTDIDMLERVGIREAGVLVATTNDDDVNIMIAQIAKEIFHVDEVITRIYDASKDITCNRMGIHVISPTRLSVDEFRRVLFQEGCGQ